jgi:hypothetical protein
MTTAGVGLPDVQHLDAAGSQLLPPYEAAIVRSKHVMVPPEGVPCVPAQATPKFVFVTSPSVSAPAGGSSLACGSDSALSAPPPPPLPPPPAGSAAAAAASGPPAAPCGLAAAATASRREKGGGGGEPGCWGSLLVGASAAGATGVEGARGAEGEPRGGAQSRGPCGRSGWASQAARRRGAGALRRGRGGARRRGRQAAGAAGAGRPGGLPAGPCRPHAAAGPGSSRPPAHRPPVRRRGQRK